MLVIGHTPHMRRKAFIIYSFLLLPLSVYGILAGDNLRKPPRFRETWQMSSLGHFRHSRQGCIHLVNAYCRGSRSRQ